MACAPSCTARCTTRRSGATGGAARLGRAGGRLFGAARFEAARFGAARFGAAFLAAAFFGAAPLPLDFAAAFFVARLVPTKRSLLGPSRATKPPGRRSRA